MGGVGALDKTKQEAGEYATLNLEGKVEASKEASKATLAEATQSIQALQEHVGRKEAEIASLQAAVDKTKQEAGEYRGGGEEEEEVVDMREAGQMSRIVWQVLNLE